MTAWSPRALRCTATATSPHPPSGACEVSRPHPQPFPPGPDLSPKISRSPAPAAHGAWRRAAVLDAGCGRSWRCAACAPPVRHHAHPRMRARAGRTPACSALSMAVPRAGHAEKLGIRKARRLRMPWHGMGAPHRLAPSHPNLPHGACASHITSSDALRLIPRVLLAEGHKPRTPSSSATNPLWCRAGPCPPTSRARTGLSHVD